MKIKSTSPPQIFLRFFRWFCHPELKDYIEGDLVELYHERLADSGKRKADLKFMIDVLLLFRPGIIKPKTNNYPTNNIAMIENYFKTGIRNILRYRVFSFINIFGLATALSVCMLVIMILADQARYDKFNIKKNRIYRILSEAQNSRQPYATSPYPLAEALKSDYPSIEETVSLRPGVGGEAVYHDKSVEMGGYFTSPAFFKVFSFELDKGNKTTALESPRSMVISEKVAKKLFGNENPLGKTIAFSDRQLPFPNINYEVGGAPVSWGNFTITGVIDESKYKSHIVFDVLVSSSTLPALYDDQKVNDETNDWENYFRAYTYALMAPGKSEADLSTALDDLVARKYANLHSEQVNGFRLMAQNLDDVQMHLYANDTNNRLPAIGYYFLYVLATIVLFSACLNYINLSIARALTRVKEIGVRKVSGAGRSSLIFQFLSESVITAFFSLAMGTGFLMLIRKGFLHLWVNQFLQFQLADSLRVYLCFIGFALAIGLLAGLLPAIHLSKFQPARALKNPDHLRP